MSQLVFLLKRLFSYNRCPSTVWAYLARFASFTIGMQSLGFADNVCWNFADTRVREKIKLLISWDFCGFLELGFGCQYSTYSSAYFAELVCCIDFFMLCTMYLPFHKRGVIFCRFRLVFRSFPFIRNMTFSLFFYSFFIRFCSGINPIYWIMSRV